MRAALRLCRKLLSHLREAALPFWREYCKYQKSILLNYNTINF